MRQFRALVTVACLAALAASQLPTAESILGLGCLFGGCGPRQPIVVDNRPSPPPPLPLVNPPPPKSTADANCGAPPAGGGIPPQFLVAPAGIVNASAPSIYTDLANTLWAILLETDDEQTCNNPAQCPCPGMFGDKNGPLPAMCTKKLTGLRCGATSRLWWRSVAHDCCTFDAQARTGGCDGSLQYELKRPENEGDAKMEEAIRAYKIARELTMMQPQNIGKRRPTMADTIILAGVLGLAKCGAPIITFTPGREDAGVANGENLLPEEKENIVIIQQKMGRVGWTPTETVALVGTGHTMAKLNGRNLDATPDKFDNRFFVELEQRSGFKLKSDIAMLENDEMVQAIKLFARDEAAFMTKAVATMKKMINLTPAVRVRRPRRSRP